MKHTRDVTSGLGYWALPAPWSTGLGVTQACTSVSLPRGTMTTLLQGEDQLKLWN